MTLTIAFISLFFAIVTVKADSGWDNSYSSSSGGSWSSSDYDSSWSSSSSSSSYGSSSSRDFHTGNKKIDKIIDKIGQIIVTWLITTIALIVLLILGLGVFYLPIMTYRRIKETKESVRASTESYNELINNLNKYLGTTDLEYVKKYFYNKFVDLQIAWMNFDYESLEKLCDNSLYNEYKAQLEALKIKNGQNIMTDFSGNTVIDKIEEVDGKIIVTAFVKISFRDYVIDMSSKNVIRGDMIDI